MNKYSILFLCLLIVAKSSAQYGTLDPTFGNQGMVINESNAGFGNNIGQKLALQPDGKIVVAAVLFGNFPAELAVLRYLTDGTLDNTFGTGGIARIPEPAFASTSALDIAIQADGKIVVVGSAAAVGEPFADFSLARFLPGGQPDLSFGVMGIAIHRIFGYAYGSLPYAIALQPDGKILLAGAKIDNMDFRIHAIVLRCLSNGAIDPAFADHGVFDFLPDTSDIAVFYDIEALSDGKIILAGEISTPTSAQHFLLMRLGPDGTPDPTFGNKGIAASGFGTQAYRIAIQPDKKIVVSGREFGGPGLQYVVARYSPAGVLDDSFAEHGVFHYYYDHYKSEGTVMSLQQDGKLVLAGILYRGQEQEQMLLRLLPNGSPDPSFGDNGRVVTTFPGSFLLVPLGMVIQPDHKIVVSGHRFISVNNLNIANTIVSRYNSNYDPSVEPPLDPDSLSALLRLYPNPTVRELSLEFAISGTSDVNVALYNMLGQWLGNPLEIKDKPKGTYKELIPLDEWLPAGEYILHFVTAEQNKFFQVIKVSTK